MEKDGLPLVKESKYLKIVLTWEGKKETGDWQMDQGSIRRGPGSLFPSQSMFQPSLIIMSFG